MNILDEVTLGPVRVIAHNRIRKPSEPLKNWHAVQQKAKQPPRVLKMLASGDFDAGNVKRTTASWGASHSDANRAVRYGLTTMRGRARDLERNDPYAKKFLELVETNMVGANGVTFQSDIGETLQDGRLLLTTRPIELLKESGAHFHVMATLMSPDN